MLKIENFICGVHETIEELAITIKRASKHKSKHAKGKRKIFFYFFVKAFRSGGDLNGRKIENNVNARR